MIVLSTVLFTAWFCGKARQSGEKPALLRLVGGQQIDHNDWVSFLSKLLVRSETIIQWNSRYMSMKIIIVNIVVNQTVNESETMCFKQTISWDKPMFFIVSSLVTFSGLTGKKMFHKFWSNLVPVCVFVAKFTDQSF